MSVFEVYQNESRMPILDLYSDLTECRFGVGFGQTHKQPESYSKGISTPQICTDEFVWHPVEHGLDKVSTGAMHRQHHIGIKVRQRCQVQRQTPFGGKCLHNPSRNSSDMLNRNGWMTFFGQDGLLAGVDHNPNSETIHDGRCEWGLLIHCINQTVLISVFR